MLGLYFINRINGNPLYNSRAYFNYICNSKILSYCMKYIGLILLLFFVPQVKAQKNQKILKLEEKKKLWDYKVNNEGEFIIHESRYTMTGYPKNGFLKYYNSDLKEHNSVELGKRKLSNYTMRTFECVIGSKFIINGSSIKNYDFKEQNATNFISKLTYNGYLFTHFQKDLKNDKGSIIEKLNCNDLSSEYFDLVIPNQTDYQGKPTIQMLAAIDPLYFMIKELKGVKEDSYHILKYDTNLKYENQIDLDVDLGDKYLRPSNNGAGGFLTIESNELRVLARRPNEGAMGNVFIINDNYYCYGMYGDANNTGKSFLNNQTFFKGYSGLYIFKFDKDGNQIWKNFYPLINSKLKKGKIMAYNNEVSLSKSSNDESLLLYVANTRKNDFEVIEVSKDNGELMKKSSYDIKLYVPSPAIHGMYGLNSYVYLPDLFGKKIKFSYNSIIAIMSNQEFYDYVKTKSKGKTTISYDAHFTEKGLLVFEELDKKKGKYNILYF